MFSNYSAKLPLGTPIVERYLGIQNDSEKCIATYIWIDETCVDLRSKSRTLNELPETISDYPQWSYDGSSTGQAKGSHSDLKLVPVAIYRDPFLGGNNRLVLCATYQRDGQPTSSNHRDTCKNVMDAIAKEEPWFGMEQEYLMLNRDGHPLGWPEHGFPGSQGPYYCGVGADRIFGREIVDTHYLACLKAGIQIAGTNAEVTPGQWEFQIGPCEGISMGDQLWMARYILHRVAEQFGVVISIDPKPPVTASGGEWNGAGCHTNFSTLAMRSEGGISAIEDAIIRITPFHSEHLKVYDPHGGMDNRRRLTGKCETSSIDNFTWGVGDRGASIRIPSPVAEDQKGYLEDRRPASNCDPYRVTAALASAALLS